MKKECELNSLNEEQNFRLDIFEDFNSINISQRKWDEFIERLNGPIYMSYDWCRIWWEVYGIGKTLRIYIFSNSDQILGIIPIYIDSVLFGPFKLRIARLIGSNIPPRIFDPPIIKEQGKLVLEKIVFDLFGKDQCDLLSFGPISSFYPPISNVKNLNKGQVTKIAVMRQLKADVISFFDLPKTFEEYLNSLSKNERKNRRKYELRYLKKRYSIQVDILKSWEDLKEEFLRFVEMHTAQWRHEGKPGHFGAWPKSIDFHLALIKELSQKGRVRLIRIIADKEPITYEYSYAFGECYYWLLPARKVDPQWEQFSLGSTSLVNMIKVAIEERIKKIEAGLAHYDYKVRLGAKEYQTFILNFVAKNIRSKIRYLIYRSIYFLINILYFKIWYQRLQPRMPKRFQRGIWSLWIRLSF